MRHNLKALSFRENLKRPSLPDNLDSSLPPLEFPEEPCDVKVGKSWGSRFLGGVRSGTES